MADPRPRRGSAPGAPMRVHFELSPRDLRYFAERLRNARAGGDLDEPDVIRRAGLLVKRARDAKPPDFVVERIEKLDRLTTMLVDEEWSVEGPDRDRILNALAYFAEPDDLVPDRVPGLGYLDDAIMVELVVRELRHELEAYDDFCAMRRKNPGVGDATRREARRRALHARMRRRVRRDGEGGGGASRGRRLLRP